MGKSGRHKTGVLLPAQWHLEKVHLDHVTNSQFVQLGIDLLAAMGQPPSLHARTRTSVVRRAEAAS